MTLTDQDKKIFAFEREWLGRRSPGAKETAIRATFGVSTATHHQRVNALIDRQDALAHDPYTVNRLRERRDRKWRGSES